MLKAFLKNLISPLYKSKGVPSFSFSVVIILRSAFQISILTVAHLRTVQSGCILILPIFASEVLVLVYPGESSHELGIVAVSSTGTSSFGSFGNKVLESSSCTANIRKFTQVPCHPARWIEKSTFLLPEVMAFFVDFATSPGSEIDERVFYDFLWPYLKGRPQKICTQRKMIETNEANEISKGSPYGHVRFGLHALLVHALHLPQDVYKRLVVYVQLCTLRHFATYFQDPCGLASLPQPALHGVFGFLSRVDVKSVVPASRLWRYDVLASHRTVVLGLEKFAQGDCRHGCRMEELYDRLVGAMQGVARKLSKIAARAESGVGSSAWFEMVRHELEFLKGKMSSEGVLSFVRNARVDEGNVEFALSKLGSLDGTVEIPSVVFGFLDEAKNALLAKPCLPTSLYPKSAQCPRQKVEQSFNMWLDDMLSWLQTADIENHFRVALLFEEEILKLAMSGDSLNCMKSWPDFVVGEAAVVLRKFSHLLQAYLTLCDEPHQHWTALRHSRIVLTVWTLACLQDVLLRKHHGHAWRHVLKNFRPPLEAHVFEHFLLPEERWMRLGHRIEAYLMSLESLEHQLLLTGPDGIDSFIALATVATSYLPELKGAWEMAKIAAERSEKEWEIRCDQKTAWINSLEIAINRDLDNPRCPKRRKVSQGSNRKLVEAQHEVKRQKQIELESVQRPLMAKVEPLPEMSEYEAEARAVILSTHLPEELSLLGSSFCLARHLFDFAAAHPIDFVERPAFSWHGHFYEFSTTRVPRLEAAPRFELFGTCEMTYREGEQQEKYYAPVQEGIGFYHPNQELEGIQLLWRWKEVLLDPFQTGWPQKGFAPPELYRMEFPNDEEEWILKLPSENLILAQLPLHFQGMSKAQFKSLGAVASIPELHLRRLLPGLHRGEFPIHDPRVKAVCQQVLYRFGPADVHCCLLAGSCKHDLEEIAAWPSALALPEQLQALDTEGGSIDSLACLMICCSYLAQFGKQSGDSHPAERAMQECRRILLSWAQDGRRHFRTQGQKSPETDRFAKTLACCIQLFRLRPSGSLSLEEAVLLAEARIDLENSLGSNQGPFNPTDMQAVKETCFLHEQQLVDDSVLDKLLAIFLPRQQPRQSKWNPPSDAPQEMWRLRKTCDGEVAIHPSRGLLLFNGKAVGHLPSEIRRHPNFKKLFGDVTCFAWLVGTEMGTFYQTNALTGKTYMLGLLTEDLLVQEKLPSGETSTLVPSSHLGKMGLRTALLKNYTHWFHSGMVQKFFGERSMDKFPLDRLAPNSLPFSSNVGSAFWT